MRGEFAYFLAGRGVIDAHAAGMIATATKSFCEVIGQLALRFGLMTPYQIEDVLATADGPKFGEAAVQAGYLSPADARCLLHIQAVEDAVEIGGTLMLEGKLTRAQMMEELKQYFSVMDPLVRALEVEQPS